VSEAGFMMDNETLQVLIGHFVELKTGINGVKTGISAVTARQEDIYIRSCNGV
jgi:hypothetical protein